MSQVSWHVLIDWLTTLTLFHYSGSSKYKFNLWPQKQEHVWQSLFRGGKLLVHLLDGSKSFPSKRPKKKKKEDITMVNHYGNLQRSTHMQSCNFGNKLCNYGMYGLFLDHLGGILILTFSDLHIHCRQVWGWPCPRGLCSMSKGQCSLVLGSNLLPSLLPLSLSCRSCF